MHQYLRAVGFSDIKTKSQLHEVLNDVIINHNKNDFIESDRSSVLVEYTKYYSESCGITLRGEYDENNKLTYDFYYPVVNPSGISTTEEVSYERHADKESFAGVCEDVRVGVTIIYYVQNGMFLMKQCPSGNMDRLNVSTGLSGLSLEGIIMLPIKKNPKEVARIQQASADRNKRIMAAKNGDEEAIEQLTLEDIDTYSAVSRRVLKDDIFTLVDSYFMPYGVECDHYSLLGEIEDYRLERNFLTDEEIYVLDVKCNDFPVTVSVNKKDLLGQPEIGRRFRGNIWLQGQVVV